MKPEVNKVAFQQGEEGQDMFSTTLSLLPVVELVSEVVRGHDVQEEDVLGLVIQP